MSDVKVRATFNKSKDTGYEVNVEEIIEALIASDSLGDLADAIDAIE